MAARAAAIVFCLAALASARRARAEDDPSCAKYQEPMAYNDCLARHGPKANGAGEHGGETQPNRAGQDRARDGEAQAPPAAFRHWPRAERIHGRVHMEFPVR